MSFDGSVELLERMAAGHLVEIDLGRGGARHVRIHHIAFHARHVAELALLAFLPIAAGLPFRIGGQHGKAGRILIFMAGGANRGRGVDR